MFSMITNVYNKKTKGSTVMELLTATGKLKKFFWQLEMFNVCITGDTAHIDYDIQVVATHASTCWRVCFLVAVKNSIKVGRLVFLL